MRSYFRFRKLLVWLTAWACLPIFLSACIGLDRKPMKINHFDIVIVSDDKLKQLTDSGAGLLVRELEIAATFDSHQFVYMIGPNQYINDYYNEFVQYPARLITEKLSRAIGDTPHFSTRCLPDTSGLQYRLSGEINKLYADFRDKEQPAAVMEITLVLEKKAENFYQPLIAKTYRQTVQMETPAPDKLAKAWGKTLGQIFDHFIWDVSEASE